MKGLEDTPEMQDKNYDYKETCELTFKCGDGTEGKFTMNYYRWRKNGKVDISVAITDGKQGRIYQDGIRLGGVLPITDKRLLTFLKDLSKFRPYLVDAIPELRGE